MATITAPSESFNGAVADVRFTDGVAETDNAAVIAYCKQAGYKVQEKSTGPFDPSKHKVEEIRAYIDGLDDTDPDARDAEFVRVVEAERSGKNRKSFMDSVEGVPATGDDHGNSEKADEPEGNEDPDGKDADETP